MAFQYAFETSIATAQCSVLPDAFDRILAARWPKSARRSKQRAHEHLVEPDATREHDDERSREDVHDSAD